MSFSALARSRALSARCSRSTKRAAFSGHVVRSALRSEPLCRDPVSIGASGGIGALRRYLNSASGEVACGARFRDLDWRLLFANPNLRPFFSTVFPNKKNYEKYYPKDKEFPRGEGNKNHKSKGDSNADEQESYLEQFGKQLHMFAAPLLFVFPLLSDFSYVSPFKIFCSLENFSGFLFFVGLSILSPLSFTSHKQKEINFEILKNMLLEPGLVDRIVISKRCVAKVYVKSSPQKSNVTLENEVPGSTTDVPTRHGPSRYKYFLKTGRVDSFEKKLEEAEKALGVNPDDYVPVNYDPGVRLEEQTFSSSFNKIPRFFREDWFMLGITKILVPFYLTFDLCTTLIGFGVGIGFSILGSILARPGRRSRTRLLKKKLRWLKIDKNSKKKQANRSKK